MSLRERAQAAARERVRQQVHTGPEEVQIRAAGLLGEMLECEVDPLECLMRVEGVTTFIETVVDDIHFRLPMIWGTQQWEATGYYVESGSRALKRWVAFANLADLDSLL